MVAGGSQDPCPVFRPSKEAFARPFSEFVEGVLKENPNVGMFKVVPPKGWKARTEAFPSLEDVQISCPIRQHVFGKQGAYRCYFVEQKKSSAAEFEKLCGREHAVVAPRDRRDDDYRERAFWSSVGIRAPCYGADTPQSFFDEKISYGWNLRDLGDLLKKYPVPCIPGVTYPMTYFGMWKAFFAWHVEDADLFSINFMHFGAGKVWYCVGPDERDKFDQMAESIFPDLKRECKAFMRHKDILLSPHVLRSYGIKYTQAKQEPGEFIVLNAGAYHSGFNLGFNCAEAVNFATESWLPLGAAATQCTCRALRDSVRISMDVFDEPPLDAPIPSAAKTTPKVKKTAGAKTGSAESSSKKRKKMEISKAPGLAGTVMSACAKGKKSHVKVETNEDVAAPATPRKKQKKVRKVAGLDQSLQKTGTGQKQGAAGEDLESSVPLGLSTTLGLDVGASDPVEGGLSEESNPSTSSEYDEKGYESERKASLLPMAIVGEDEVTKARYFYLVKCLGQGSEGMMVQWLKEGSDGLFRLTDSVWSEDGSSLLKVRTQWVDRNGTVPGGYKLLTLRCRILDTVLI